MTKFELTRMELVWPGKYDENGRLSKVERARLPFQVIERINESRATREVNKLPKQTSLFDIYEAKEGETYDDGWRNKLIWGDNLLIMGSLLEHFAGKVELIYIDPPFATGADFSFSTQIGEEEVLVKKEQSILEEKAYRDTWGRGFETYLQMLYERFILMRDLLSESGTIYVHVDPTVSPSVRLLLDEVFGGGNFLNEIAWCYQERERILDFYNPKHDVILFYAKKRGAKRTFNWQAATEEYSKVTLAKFKYQDEKGHYLIRGRNVQGSPVRAGDGLTPADEERYPGLTYRDYQEDRAGVAPRDWWQIGIINKAADERLYYPTQKPEKLLERIIGVSSEKGQLVADFFCGSGTTLAVAEKLGRRWIGSDLGRFGIHTTRKRLLGIENCKPFEIMNLGKYERQYWQGITFNKGKQATEQAIFEYLAFILKLYGAQPVSGTVHLHGKKGKSMVHIGAVDAPVTIDEINLALDECAKLKQSELHVLGWEWEMGVAGPSNDYHTAGLMHEVARQKGIKLFLFQIPREAMEQQAVDKGDVQFFELAYLEVEIYGDPKEARLSGERAVTNDLANQLIVSNPVAVHIKDFVIANTDLIPPDVRDKVKKWSDYIDYWAVDWNFQNDTFMNGWVTYRIRKDRCLVLQSETHTYETRGRYTIIVKVVDIFGNDTTQAYEVEVS